MRGNTLLTFLIIQIILSCFTEILFQTKYNISGLGIISMLFFVVTDIHDIFFDDNFQGDNERKKRRAKLK